VENSKYSSYYSSHDFFRDTVVGQNAVGFTTAGGALKTMAIGGFAYESTAEWQGQILSNHSGLPGNELYHTQNTTESDTGLCCTSLRTLKFTPKGQSLPAGSYFATVACENSPCY